MEVSGRLFFFQVVFAVESGLSTVHLETGQLVSMHALLGDWGGGEG